MFSMYYILHCINYKGIFYKCDNDVFTGDKFYAQLLNKMLKCILMHDEEVLCFWILPVRSNVFLFYKYLANFWQISSCLEQSYIAVKYCLFHSLFKKRIFCIDVKYEDEDIFDSPYFSLKILAYLVVSYVVLSWDGNYTHVHCSWFS